ncbi:MAG: sensor domain-containing diguanylate cyclase [Nocardioidaceae bacterium]
MPPMPDAAGDARLEALLTGTSAVATARETGLAQVRALARSVPHGFVLLYDADLRIVLADGTDLGTFGHTRGDLEGRLVREVLAPEHVADVEPRYRAALSGRRVSWEREVRSGVFRLTAAPVVADDGSIISGMVLAQDVTEERRNERSWAALHAIATAVARNEDPYGIAQRIADSLHDVFAVDTAAVVRFTGPTSGESLALAPAGALSLSPLLELLPDDVSALAKVRATGQPTLVNYRADGGAVSSSMAADGMTVGAAAPIGSGESTWGAVVLTARDEHRIDANVLARLTGFADLLQLAIGNTEAWRALEHEAGTDALSGLPNRRTFAQHLRRELERSDRHGRPLSLALMDLDGLKHVNDTCGHLVGDRVIAELAARIRPEARDGELLARLGGDEFGWILPETDAEGALAAAERLRAVVAAAPFPDVGRLSLSIGVCSLADVAGPKDLLAGADDALYAAKRAGRDQVARYAPA